jgi:hypothetical protein
MEVQTMYSVNPHVSAIIDPDGAVILDISRNQIFALDAMGGYVWRLLERGATRDDIVSDIVEQTKENSITVERDVTDFIETLTNRQLIAKPDCVEGT